MTLRALTACAAAALGLCLVPGPALARGSNLHVCAGDRAAVTPAPPRPGSAAPPPRASAPPPVLIAGCLPAELPLTRLALPETSTATAIAADRSSRAAIFGFGSPDRRDRRIRDWLADVTRAGEPVPQGTLFYINGWAQRSNRLPSGDTVHAMYREAARAGRLCLVSARSSRLPAALPALNNWCMDKLAIRRK